MSQKLSFSFRARRFVRERWEEFWADTFPESAATRHWSLRAVSYGALCGGAALIAAGATMSGGGDVFAVTTAGWLLFAAGAVLWGLLRVIRSVMDS